ncbi:MAG: ABC transporter ATP-binding protein [Opitutales bacterium]
MNTILETHSLTKKFGSITAVNDLSFSLSRSSITALLGGNGAGKTTTLSMLLGLLRPSFLGKLASLGRILLKTAFPVLGRMNFSSPYVDLPQRLTVGENLLVYAKLYGVVHPKERIQKVAKSFRLEQLLDQRLRRLSSGQKTRVSLAKSLINEPEFLLLDEPTASLDPDTTVWIREFLREYRDQRGATILFASHDMREVELLCDEALLMKEGKLVEKGSPQGLLDKYQRNNLEEVFLQVNRKGME